MKPMIASKNRVILILMAAGVLILTVSLFLLRKTPQKPDQTYAEGVNNYAAQLKDNGLIAVKQISQSDGGEAFITMLVPGTGEVTDQDVEQLTELLIFTAQVFENRGGSGVAISP